MVPPWIELGQEVTTRQQAVLGNLANSDSAAGADSAVGVEVDKINLAIARFNTICPVSSLQKPRFEV